MWYNNIWNKPVFILPADAGLISAVVRLTDESKENRENSIIIQNIKEKETVILAITSVRIIISNLFECNLN